MKSHFHLQRIALALYLYFSSPATATTTQDKPDNVLLLINSDKTAPFTMRIEPNGDLSSANLPTPTDVTEAQVLGHDGAACFFWRPEDNSAPPPVTWGEEAAEWVSTVFTPGQPLKSDATSHQKPQPTFPRAQRVYCYDTTRENSTDGIFTLFMESASGQTRLLRLALPAAPGQRYVELDLVNAKRDGDGNSNSNSNNDESRINIHSSDTDSNDSNDSTSSMDSSSNFMDSSTVSICPDDCINARFALLHAPQQLPPAACYLMSPHRRQHPFDFFVTHSSLIDFWPPKRAFKSRRPLGRTDRVVCFDDYAAVAAKRRYVEEFLL